MELRLPTKRPAPTRFRVVDQTSTRKDLAERREVKFALEGADVDQVRSLLESNCRRQIHNEPVSVVRSVYFDNASLAACRANLDGLGRRRKLRLRWYDSPLPQSDVFLEIKWRDNRVTGKHRLHIRSSEPLEGLRYSEILAELDQVLPAEHRRELACSPEPVMIIQYRREHFVSDDSSLRLTLDYDMMYYDQMGRERLSTEFACRLENLLVVEGKIPVGRDSDLRRILHPAPLRATRCSKYVHGCRLLGHIVEAD